MKLRNYFINLIAIVFVLFSFVLPVSAQTSEAQEYPVKYRAHVSNIGWQDYVTSPNEAGTTGQNLPMEAIDVNSDGPAVTVQAHVQNIGWMDPVTNGVAGTTGQAKNLEAVKITLSGQDADKYDVKYQTHVKNIGWMDWKQNGQQAGTTGQSLPIEAIRINVVSKTASSTPSTSIGGTDDASGFVALSDVAPDILQEVRYYSTYNFVGDRIDGYEEPTILMTRQAAEAVKAANDELMTKGMRLRVYDAYRPQQAVDHFVRWSLDFNDQRMKEYFYPDLDKSVLFEESYIASKSGHTRGSTIDLTIFDDKTGQNLDMGGIFDLFDERSHPDYVGDLTQEQIDNRNILRNVMIGHGFRPLASEWWHFTLNDEPYKDTYFTFPVSNDSVAH